MDDLAVAAKSMGFAAQGINIEPPRSVELPGPAIVHLSNLHFAVVEPSTSQWCVFIDPPHSPRLRPLRPLR